MSYSKGQDLSQQKKAQPDSWQIDSPKRRHRIAHLSGMLRNAKYWGKPHVSNCHT